MKQVSIAVRCMCKNLSMFHQSLSIDITFDQQCLAPMPLLMDPEFVVCISAHSVHLLLMGGGVLLPVSHQFVMYGQLNFHKNLLCCTPHSSVCMWLFYSPFIDGVTCI